MSDRNIAIIGDKDSVTAFRAAGVDVFSPSELENAEDLIKKLAKLGYAIILITEDEAAKISNFILQNKAKPYPIILPLPAGNGANGLGIGGLKHNIEKAIGMDIIFNK